MRQVRLPAILFIVLSGFTDIFQQIFELVFGAKQYFLEFLLSTYEFEWEFL